MKKLALTAVLTMGLGLAACSQETSDHASNAAESASEDMKRAADAAGNAAEDAAKAAGSAADAAAHKADEAASKAGAAAEKLGVEIF